jgi:50S ribosomal protein L16 3-hydroxylase
VPEFLRGFWHKDALLVRAALPGFAGLFTAAELQALAMRDDVESRLVVRDGSRWSFAEGPFRRADFRSLPARQWTLLVQGVNLHSAPADALLRRFSFLPYARLDDLMVSYAVPGGGVGPHFDSYDVFLLQGFGAGAALRAAGRPEPSPACRSRSCAASPGPRRRALGPATCLPAAAVAHDGIAVDACTTY